MPSSRTPLLLSAIVFLTLSLIFSLHVSFTYF